jgi:protoheme IX farnesyltransferase
VSAPRPLAADLFGLLKPGITAMSVFMAAGALALAPWPGWRIALVALSGLAALVGAANALNMYLERDTDGLMARTMDRPLPARRMRPGTALAFGAGLSALALALLFAVNLSTFSLGVVALLLYLGVYTPLKRRTPAAVIVGAVPGAMPALMGWTAATGRIEPVGLALFLVLFAWQIPHFLAISIFRRDDYTRAGMKVVPAVRGDAAAWRETFAYTTTLLPLSLALVPLGAGGPVYVALALAGGTWLLVLAVRGLAPGAGARQARSYFLATLAYLPMLVAGLVVDGAMR